MKKIILLLFFAPLLGHTQSKNETKIMRDIEVAENILASLLQETVSSEGQYVILSGRGMSDVEGTYIEDVGVLFTIGGRSGLLPVIPFGQGGAYSYSFNFDDGARVRVPHILKLQSERDRARSKDNKEEMAETKIITPFDFFKDVTEEFLVNYGYLIRGIKPQEKIMIRYGTKSDYVIAIAGWDQDENAEWNKSSLFTAMVLKSDIDALQKGSITEEQLAGKIEYNESEAEVEEENREVKLINSIFTRLYKEDLSGNSCIRGSGSPNSEYIPDLGLVVQMKMTARCRDRSRRFDRLEFFRDGDVKGNIQLADPKEKEDEEGEEKRENPDDHYPQFLESLKQNIVEYGSIAKSLAKDEVMVFKVTFSGCRECTVIPENLSLTAKQSTLTAYRQGKISLEQALGQLNIAN